MNIILCQHGVLASTSDFNSITQEIKKKINPNQNNNHKKRKNRIMKSPYFKSTVEEIKNISENNENENYYYIIKPNVNLFLKANDGIVLCGQRLFFEFLFLFHRLLYFYQNDKNYENENNNNNHIINIDCIGHSFGGIILREFIYLLLTADEKDIEDLFLFYVQNKNHKRKDQIIQNIIFHNYNKDPNEVSFFARYVRPFREGKIIIGNNNNNTFENNNKNYFLIQFQHFITIASPHCGITLKNNNRNNNYINYNNTILEKFYHFVSCVLYYFCYFIFIKISFFSRFFINGQTFRDLCFFDQNNNNKKPILNNDLIDKKHLNAFQNFNTILFYSNYKDDLLVSADTSSTLMEYFYTNENKNNENNNPFYLDVNNICLSQKMNGSDEPLAVLEKIIVNNYNNNEDNNNNNNNNTARMLHTAFTLREHFYEMEKNNNNNNNENNENRKNKKFSVIFYVHANYLKYLFFSSDYGKIIIELFNHNLNQNNNNNNNNRIVKHYKNMKLCFSFLPTLLFSKHKNENNNNNNNSHFTSILFSFSFIATMLKIVHFLCLLLFQSLLTVLPLAHWVCLWRAPGVAESVAREIIMNNNNNIE